MLDHRTQAYDVTAPVLMLYNRRRLRMLSVLRATRWIWRRVGLVDIPPVHASTTFSKIKAQCECNRAVDHCWKHPSNHHGWLKTDSRPKNLSICWSTYIDVFSEDLPHGIVEAVQTRVSNWIIEYGWTCLKEQFASPNPTEKIRAKLDVIIEGFTATNGCQNDL
jgi:hypothetical protein